MAKLSIVKGATSVLARVFIQDSSSTTGAGLTGLAFNTAGLTCYRMRDDDGNAGGTAITLATATRGTWASGGFVEKDSTNCPGWYEFGIPNAALATGSRSADFHFKGATNMAPLPVEIELTGTDNQDAVHGGMSALPNTACTTNASLLTSGTGTDQFSVSGGRGKADTVYWNASAVAAPNVTGVPKVDVVDWLGTAVTAATAGVPDTNAKNINNVSTSSVTTINANIGTTQPLNFTGTAASALVKCDMVDIAGAAVSTSTAQIGVNVVNVAGSASAGAAGYMGVDWGALTNKTTTNALTGTSISSVSGSVGSVTGNVGGTVFGTVTANVTQWGGTTVATPNTAGVPVVDTRQVIRQGTAQATGNSTTAIKLDSGASATDGAYKGMAIQVISGTGSPQVGLCTAYVGSTKIATIAPAWPTAPDSTSVFQVFPAMVDVETWLETVPNALISGRVDSSLGANNAGNLTADVQTIKGQTVTCAAGVTVNANAGTTQPVNFTGTSTSALVKVDAIDWGSVAVGGMPNSGKVAVSLAAADVTGNLPADVQTIKTQTVTCAGAVTIPAATLASTTNITAGTITTTTNLTNLPSIPANWLTASGIAASALNGKGDWLLSSSYTAPPTTAAIATAVWTDTTAGDFATASSPGKVLVTQLGGAFTNATGSVFTTAALANGPSGTLTAAAVATAVLTDTISGDLGTQGSIGYIITHQLGGAFTTSTSSVYTVAALANAPGGTGGAGTTAVTQSAGGSARSPSDMTVQNGSGQPIMGAVVEAYLATAYAANPATAAVIAATTTDVSGHWALNLTNGATYTLIVTYPNDTSSPLTGSVTV